MELRLESLRLFPGARFGLRQKTALVELACQGLIDIAAWRQDLSALLEDAERAGWVSSKTPAEPATAIAHGIRDILMLLLGWRREPVFEAEVLEAGAGRLVLAAGWENGRTFARALELTLLAANPAVIRGLSALKTPLDEFRMDRTGLPSVLVARLTASAFRAGHPVTPRGDFLQIGWGSRARRLTHAMTDATSAIAVRVARRKYHANRLLAEAGLPVPGCHLVSTVEKAREAARSLAWPVVVKPAEMDGGVAVTTDIRTAETLDQAFAAAAAQGGRVIVEKHVPGHDYRLLVVGDRVLAGTKRTPGGVTGDGRSSIVQLIDQANADPRRGSDKQADLLLRLELDDEAGCCLADAGLDAASVPPAGNFVRLRRAANISLGGTAEDVTDRIHPDNRKVAIRAARTIGLDIAGIDFLCPDIEQSWLTAGGWICEVNAQPMLRVHWLADPQRDLESEIVAWLTQGRPTRIPVTAVAGEAAGATARLIHRIMTATGRVPGSAAGGIVSVGDDVVCAREQSGFSGARMVLNDPVADMAILALQAADLDRSGHPCDRYDMAVLTTPWLTQDGLAGTERELLERTCSAVVTEIGNGPADDAGAAFGQLRHVAVSIEGESPRVRMPDAGECISIATVEDRYWVVWSKGEEVEPIIALADLDPACETDGRPILFAVAAAIAHGIDPGDIGAALRHPSH